MDIQNVLPPCNFIIKEDNFGNLLFECVDSFEFKGKRYGDNIRNTERILNTFLSREQSTGVMLAGEKGSGKSLLAKMLSIEAAKNHNIPTILINAPWYGDKFNTLMQDIQQPCVILFDEFEKVYDHNDQPHILTLLDGVFPSKKLFILTCNDKYRIDEHMRNRPGRIFYMLDFDGLEQSFVIEYCQDNLVNKTHLEGVCRVATMFDKFNFDMLKALVEEMNRYNESPQDAMKMLNTKPEFSSNQIFTTKLLYQGVWLNHDHNEVTNEFEFNPLLKTFRLSFQCEKSLIKVLQENGKSYADVTQTELDKAAAVKNNEIYKNIHFTPSHIVDVDPEKGIYTYKVEDVTLILTKKKVASYDYWKAF